MRRLTSVLTTAAITVTLQASATGTAAATHEVRSDSTGSNMPALVAAVAEANQRVADLGADIQSKQEAINRALVETATARATLAATQHQLASVNRQSWPARPTSITHNDASISSPPRHT